MTGDTTGSKLERPPKWTLFVDGIQACLRGSAPLAPLAAGILVLTNWWATDNHELLGLGLPVQAVGLVALLVAWAVVAVLYFALGMTHVKRANASTYCELRSQLTELHGTYVAVCQEDGLWREGCVRPGSVNDIRVRNQFDEYTREVGEALDGKLWGRTVWVLGVGYVSAWQMLHRAQEALLNIEPPGAVVERAEYDRLRLAGSSIEGHAELRECLGVAIDLLSPLASSGDANAIGHLADKLLTTDRRLATLSAVADIAHKDSAGQELDSALSLLTAVSLPVERKMPLYSALSAAQTRLVTPAQVHQPVGPNGATNSAPFGVQQDWLPEVAAAREQIHCFLTRIDQAEQQQPTLPTQVGSSISQVHTVCAATPPTSLLRPPRSVSEARTVVGSIRQTLNTHRDESRAGLVRARNQLACTTVVTGLIAYGVLWLALMAGVSADRVRVGVGFFLIAALVGLFSRLYSDFGNDSATDDFGLSAMRHLTAPQLSGVAGVLGVALVALTSNMNTPSATDVFDLAFQFPAHPIYYLSAALFGFTPGLLIDRLKQQTDQLKNNLRTTEPQAQNRPVAA